MRKIKNILQMSLLIVLTQITLVLLTTPLPKSLGFQQSSFVFLFILFFAGLLYLYGYFLFISMKELSLKVAVLFSFVYLSLFVVEKLNGLQTLYDPFWQRYPVSSIVPFYYFNPKLL